MREFTTGDRDREILNLHDRDGLSLGDIGERFKLTSERVRQICNIQRPRARIRAYWQEREQYYARLYREEQKRRQALHNLQACCDALYTHAIRAMGAALKEEYAEVREL